MQTDHSHTPSKDSKQNFMVPVYILDDLCSRFIINIPEEERQDLIRIFFQIELAHWFYLDFYCEENPQLKACGIKDFSAQIFRHCPTLSEHANNVDKILESWREYKMAVPTYGAILMDPALQYCLLVQGFWSKASWGFPKGKVNEEELPLDCAVREVLEETGFDIAGLIDKDEYIEYKMNEQLSRLYLVPGVSMDTKFQPRTRKEIKCLEWFKIEYLPLNKKDLTCRQHYGLNPNAFFMLIPFVKPLRRWINKQTSRQEFTDPERQGRTRRESQSELRSDNRVRRESQGDSRVPQEKQRQKQQQHFSQDINSQFKEYMQFKEPSVSSKKDKGSLRGQQDSPQGWHSSKHKQQKRDKFSGGSQNQTRRSLATQFTDDTSTPPKHKKGHKDKIWSHTWAHFKLDTGAILEAMFPVSGNNKMP